MLAPEQTEGPYYIANEKIRRNITDGRRGRSDGSGGYVAAITMGVVRS